MAIQKRKLGWTGVEIPVIGQGTWMIEGSNDKERRAIDALRAGLDLGMTHIDTAEMYGSGRSETLVGEAIKGRRDEIFLVSKVLPSNASYDGTLRACDRTLQRLKVDSLDMYLLHWSGSYPIRDTMRAMEKLVDTGKTRFIGVSNFDVDEVQEAEGALRNHRLACNQVLYYLNDRGIERRLIPYCTSRKIAIVGYSPYGHGNFPSPTSPGGRVLADVAKRNSRTVRQVVLQFLTRHRNVFTIPKAGIPDHTRENSGGSGWTLPEDDLAAIDAAFPAPDYDTPLGML